MTVGDLVMVKGLFCRHNDCGRSSDGEQPVFVGTMTVGDLVMVISLCL